MPSIESRVIALDPSTHESVNPQQTRTISSNSNSLEPGLNTTLRSTLPPIYAASDNQRQYYQGGQVPQYRIIPAQPLSK